MENKKTFPKPLFYLSMIFMIIASFGRAAIDIAMIAAYAASNVNTNLLIQIIVEDSLASILALGLFVFGIIACTWAKGRFAREFVSSIYLPIVLISIAAIRMIFILGANTFSFVGFSFCLQVLVLGILALAFRPKWPKATHIMLAAGSGSVAAYEFVSLIAVATGGNPYYSIVFGLAFISMIFFFICFLVLAVSKETKEEDTIAFEEKKKTDEEGAKKKQQFDQLYSLLSSGTITQEEFNNAVERLK